MLIVFRSVDVNCKILFQGVGTVVSGISLKGIIHTNDTLLLGPDSLGNFIPVAIKSIHRKRLPVKEVRSGQTASFALKKVNFHCFSNYELEFYLFWTDKKK